MLTFNRLIESLCNAGQLNFEGVHYREEVPVYAGYLWGFVGNDSKRLHRLTDIAERKGVQLRFEDEIVTDDNGRVHERIPGFYGQTPTWQIIGCSVWSQDEALTHTDRYIEELLESEAEFSATRWLSDAQFKEQGFTLFDFDAETGFHAGQNDTPEKVRDRFLSTQADTDPGHYEFLFQITDEGQFDTHWRMWWRRPEWWSPEEEEEEGE